MGSKQIKMIFTDKAEAGKSVTNVDVPVEDRQRFSITDAEVTELAHYALTIEKHYGRPMDIEWAATAWMANSTSCKHALKP